MDELERQRLRLEHFESVIHVLEGAGKDPKLIDAAAVVADRQKKVLEILCAMTNDDGDDPMMGPDPEAAARALANRIASSYKHTAWYREYSALKPISVK